MKFIVFGEDWGAHPSSTQHLFRFIMQHHQVIWFNSVGMRTPKLNWIDIRRMMSKCFKMLLTRRVSKSSTRGLTAINPLILPWHSNKLVKQFNKRQVMRSIRVGDEPVVYWVSVPSAIDMITVRPQDTLIYYCGDDFSSLSGVDHEMIKPCEEALIFQADTIFVASHALLRKMPAHKTQVLEHGVDYNLFTQLSERHPSMNGLKNVVGFYGSISSWLDYELLHMLAIERPDYHLILVGKAEVDIEGLAKKHNVTFIPEVTHHDLIRFSQHWDVSILPFLDNKQIRSCNPLKLKEYLAVGAPIVATRFPAVERYSDLVFVADDHRGFLARVDYAMSVAQTPKLGWAKLSREYVVKHTWQKKAEYVLAQL